MELPRIEQMRRRALKGGPCATCGKSEATLEAHHENYRPDSLVWLCHRCHHARHYYPQALPFHARMVLARARARAKPSMTPEDVQQYAEKMHPVGKKDLS